ncbi:hypothetical protein, partial [Niallia taxi]|uniref:hypothetical protein n=1 Tax=Niallia taxi TaxID=2499688 RepID=UPI001C714EAF
PRTEFILFLDEKATKRSAVVTPAFSTLANKEYTTTILTNTDPEFTNLPLYSFLDGKKGQCMCSLFVKQKTTIIALFYIL